MTEVHSFYYLIKRFCFILYKKFAKILPQDTAVKKNAYACQHPPRQGVLLYGNAWGGLFIVVGRLAMPLVR